jgi:hypothetical protein
MTKKIKFLKPNYYNCNYPAGSIVEVEDNYAAYMIGMDEAIEVDSQAKVTEPTPYVMKQRETPTDKALTILAEILKKDRTPQPPAKV